jgi:hypothetical protein
MARTFFKSVLATAAIFNPSAVTTFSAITTLNTNTVTINVPRQFSPFRQTFAIFTTGLPAGVFVGPITVTGNDPTSGATPAVYTANITLYNSTSGSLTPAAQQVILFQV